MNAAVIYSVTRPNEMSRGSLAVSVFTAAQCQWRSAMSFLVEILHTMSFTNKTLLGFAFIKAATPYLCARHEQPGLCVLAFSLATFRPITPIARCLLLCSPCDPNKVASERCSREERDGRQLGADLALSIALTPLGPEAPDALPYGTFVAYARAQSRSGCVQSHHSVITFSQ